METLNKNIYYAHSGFKSDFSDWETLEHHSLAVANKCYEMGGKFGIGNICYIIGLLHDAGKIHPDFQRKIKTNDKSVMVDHSSLGCYLLKYFFKCDKNDNFIKNILFGLMLSIAGHHSGIKDIVLVKDRLANVKFPDDANFIEWLKIKVEDKLVKIKMEIENINSLWRQIFRNGLEEISYDKSKLRESHIDKLMAFVFTKIAYSVLVRADSHCTESFYSSFKKFVEPEANVFTKETLQNNIQKYHSKVLGKKFSDSEFSKIQNLARNEIYESALENFKVGFDSHNMHILVAHTGSGKTRIAIGFFEEAILRGYSPMYTAPRNSVLNQNVKEDFFGVFGEDNCELDYGTLLNCKDTDLNDLKGDFCFSSWDSPFVVTSFANFLDVFFDNTRGGNSKLINLHKKIIFVDEAQYIEEPKKNRWISIINIMSKILDFKVVFCSATMPIFLNGKCNDISPHNKNDLYKKYFERSGVEFDKYTTNTEYLASQVVTTLKKDKSVLVIVNYRKDARALFDELKDKCKADVYMFISGQYTKKDFIDKIEFIKTELKSGKSFVLVATQLIDCGVDISFPVIFEDVSGYNTSKQRNGRCNRSGEYPIDSCFQKMIYLDNREEEASNKLFFDERQYTKRFLLANGKIQFTDNDQNERFSKGLDDLYKRKLFSGETMFTGDKGNSKNENKKSECLENVLQFICLSADDGSGYTKDGIDFDYVKQISKFIHPENVYTQVYVTNNETKKIFTACKERAGDISYFSRNRRKILNIMANHEVSFENKDIENLKSDGIVYQPLKQFEFLPDGMREFLFLKEQHYSSSLGVIYKKGSNDKSI